MPFLLYQKLLYLLVLLVFNNFFILIIQYIQEKLFIFGLVAQKIFNNFLGQKVAFFIDFLMFSKPYFCQFIIIKNLT